MDPKSKKRSRRLTLWLIGLLVFLPFISIMYRLIILSAMIAVYGKSTIIILIFCYSALLLIITKNYKIYRTMANILFYQYLQCETVITLPSTPTIFLANYPSSALNYLVPGIFPEKTCILSACPPFLSNLTAKPGSIIQVKVGGGNYEKTKQEISTKLKEGYCIFAYVDDSLSKKHDIDINKLHKGMFNISKELKATIVPIALERISLGPLAQIQQKKFRISIGKGHIVKDVDRSMKYAKLFLQKSLNKFKKTEY